MSHGGGAVPLRVVVVDHSAEPAGGEVALLRLLAATDHDAFRISVLLLDEGPLAGMLRDQGVRTAVLPISHTVTAVARDAAVATPWTAVVNAARALGIVPRLAAAIRGSGAELVVANTLKSAVLTAFAAPLAGLPWVWHLHDRIAEDYLPAGLVRALRILGTVAPRAVIANSQATRATMPALTAPRIVVAYPPAPERLERGTWSPPAVAVFGLLGRIAPTKGQREFLNAAGLLAARVPEARYRVLGDALFNDHAFAADIRAMPGALGIADRVEFTGWVDDAGAAMSRLTALVHASPVPEPFGQVIVEGMLTGVPVIASDAGGVPEILDPDHDRLELADGVARTRYGLLVRAGDSVALAEAMAWVYDNPDVAAAAAAEASAYAARTFADPRNVRVIEEAWRRARARRGLRR